MSVLNRPRIRIQTKPLHFKNKFASTGYSPPLFNGLANTVHFFQGNPETVQSVEARDKALDVKRRLERMNAKAFTDKEQFIRGMSKADKQRKQMLTFAKIKQYLSQRAEAEGINLPNDTLNAMFQRYIEAEAAKSRNGIVLNQWLKRPDTLDGLNNLLQALANPRPLIAVNNGNNAGAAAAAAPAGAAGPNREPAGNVQQRGSLMDLLRSGYDYFFGNGNDVHPNPNGNVELLLPNQGGNAHPGGAGEISGGFLSRKTLLGDYDSRESGIGILAPSVRPLFSLVKPKHNKPEIAELPTDRVERTQNSLNDWRSKYREDQKEVTGVVPSRTKIKEAFPDTAAPFDTTYFHSPSGLSVLPFKVKSFHEYK